jgi:hypothetical protein
MNLQPLPEIYYRDSLGIHGQSPNNAINQSNPSPNQLGVVGFDKYGRKFRWVLAGAANLVAGTLVSAPAWSTAQVGLAVNAVVTGTSSFPSAPLQFIVTPAANVFLTSNSTGLSYVGGKVVVSNGGGVGFAYTVASHTPGNSTVNATFTIDSSESFQGTANSLTIVDLVPNPYNGVVIAPTAAVSEVVGVAHSAVPAGMYGWVGVSGDFPVLCDSGAPAIGTPVTSSIITAGAVGTLGVIGSANANVVLLSAQVVGTMKEAAVSAKYKLIQANIS